MITNAKEAISASLKSLIDDKYQTYRLYSIGTKKTSKHIEGDRESVFKGRGMAFDSVREYQSGDDVRLVDWRITAKQGKTYTKIFKEERERQIWFLIDLRRSMHFGTKQAFKSVVAAHTLSMLAWYFLQKGDKIGGLILTDDEMITVRPSRFRKDMMRFLGQVSEATYKKVSFELVNPEPEISLTKSCLKLRKVCRTGNFVFVLSDFSDWSNELFKCLASLSKNNEVTLINIYDQLEGRCPDPNVYEITDGRQVVELDTREPHIKKAYIYYFQKKLMALTEFTRLYAIRYLPLTTGEDFYDVVARFLQRKKK